MKKFSYIITDSVGIHARPAGILVKLASQYSSEITISCGEKTADAKKLFSVMGIGAVSGSEVTVSANGPDEDEAIDKLMDYFHSSL
ncbi:MAG: HPr family phosphocarrier protein [Oscillospiraceae bacterium]|nr:HPr family phosphocarrier protein [Oscillospiraceae bacterium]